MSPLASQHARSEAEAAEAPDGALGRIMLPAVIPQRALAKTDWDEAIAAMNERHAIIDNVGGKTMIASWEPSSLVPSRLEVVFQSKESFLLRYSNRSVAIDLSDARGGTRRETLALGQWWLTHRERRQHRGVTFLSWRLGASEGLPQSLAGLGSRSEAGGLAIDPRAH